MQARIFRSRCNTLLFSVGRTLWLWDAQNDIIVTSKPYQIAKSEMNEQSALSLLQLTGCIENGLCTVQTGLCMVRCAMCVAFGYNDRVGGAYTPHSIAYAQPVYAPSVQHIHGLLAMLVVVCWFVLIECRSTVGSAVPCRHGLNGKIGPIRMRTRTGATHCAAYGGCVCVYVVCIPVCYTDSPI